MTMARSEKNRPEDYSYTVGWLDEDDTFIARVMEFPSLAGERSRRSAAYRGSASGNGADANPSRPPKIGRNKTTGLDPLQPRGPRLLPLDRRRMAIPDGQRTEAIRLKRSQKTR